MPTNSQKIRISKLAAIQYAGRPGISSSCYQAVKRLVQSGESIGLALVLSCDGRHGFLLTLDDDGPIGVKTGFSSGYQGEGPRTFGAVIRLLKNLQIELEECEVEADMLERLDASALTQQDLELIYALPNKRPQQWHYYTDATISSNLNEAAIYNQFRSVIPWSIIDHRIIDLAKRFFNNPDDAILTGFRRLEDLIRTRTGLMEHGTKLFAQAFTGSNAKLTWAVDNNSESIGRAGLFPAAYMAYRNPRAHREIATDLSNTLTEFLLLNHLFLIEALAQTNDTDKAN